MKTPEQKIQEIRKLKQRGATNRQIAKELDVGVATVSRYTSKQSPEPPSKHIKPRFDVPPQNAVDPLEFIDQAIERIEAHPPDPDYSKIAIDTKQPIAVIKAADFHFGGLDVDYQALKEHIKFLLQTPNFYLQLFGDDLNLMIMHRVTGARHDGWTPEEQVYWLESFVNECVSKGKLISMCWGNHSDEFTERNAGFGLVRMLMKAKIPYFRGMGYIDLKVGNQTYPMGFTHKVRFNSFMNALHGNKRLQQMHSEFFGINRMPCREYITAHTHNPAVSWEGCLPEERVYFIKCGSFKTNCLFSQRYYGQGRIGAPTVVYHPDRICHICFPTPWEAHAYMEGLKV